jgi:integrase
MHSVGRPKKHHRALPPRLRLAHGSYFYADSRGGPKPWVKIGATYAEAILRYAQLEATTARDFNALCERYVKEALPTKAATTQRVYKTHLKPLRGVFGTMPPNEITQPMAYQYLDRRGPGTRGRQEIAVLASVLRFGIRLGWVTEPRLRGMEFGKAKRRKRYITDEELHNTLAQAPLEVAHAIRFIHYTGLRTSDALRVRWRDWKPDGLHVHISKVKADLVFDRTPGLEGLMAEMKNRLIVGTTVLADRQGRPWHYQRLHAAWTKVAPEDANLHDLRRKRLTDLAKARGVDFAQLLAAHSDPRMTQSYVAGATRVAI